MSKKILVVDDEKLIVKGICFSLEQEGMEVDCAYDGEEALEYAKKCEYDLVLLDVMARIKAIMRRTAKRKEEPAQSPMLVKGNMKIDC